MSRPFDQRAVERLTHLALRRQQRKELRESGLRGGRRARTRLPGSGRTSVAVRFDLSASQKSIPGIEIKVRIIITYRQESERFGSAFLCDFLTKVGQAGGSDRTGRKRALAESSEQALEPVELGAKFLRLGIASEVAELERGVSREGGKAVCGCRRARTAEATGSRLPTRRGDLPDGHGMLHLRAQTSIKICMFAER